MSVTGKRGVGIPIILLHDAEGTIVTVEVRTGETFRGYLDESEDNMNIILRDAVKTDVNGKQSKVELVYIKGTQVSLVVLPDMLKKAPMFKRIAIWKKYKGNVPALGVGMMRGQAAAIKQGVRLKDAPGLNEWIRSQAQGKDGSESFWCKDCVHLHDGEKMASVVVSVENPLKAQKDFCFGVLERLQMAETMPDKTYFVTEKRLSKHGLDRQANTINRHDGSLYCAVNANTIIGPPEYREKLLESNVIVTSRRRATYLVYEVAESRLEDAGL